MDKRKRTFAYNVLRRGSFKWPARWAADKRAKLSERNSYFCEKCGVIGGKKDFEFDHIIPCIPPQTGWDNFDSVIDRMYCEPEGWQRLCIPCHLEKSLAEGQVRTIVRRKVKKSIAKKK